MSHSQPSTSSSSNFTYQLDKDCTQSHTRDTMWSHATYEDPSDRDYNPENSFGSEDSEDDEDLEFVLPGEYLQKSFLLPRPHLH